MPFLSFSSISFSVFIFACPIAFISPAVCPSAHAFNALEHSNKQCNIKHLHFANTMYFCVLYVCHNNNVNCFTKQH